MAGKIMYVAKRFHPLNCRRLASEEGARLLGESLSSLSTDEATDDRQMTLSGDAKALHEDRTNSRSDLG
jgi:hypothetical protein